MNYTLKGKLVSKKNSKRIFKTREGRPFIASSSQYLKWAKDAVDQLAAQEGVRFTNKEAVHIIVDIYQGKGVGLDLDNALAGIFDVLQASKIIGNDRQIKSASVRLMKDVEDPRAEIILYGISTATISEVF